MQPVPSRAPDRNLSVVAHAGEGVSGGISQEDRVAQDAGQYAYPSANALSIRTAGEVEESLRKFRGMSFPSDRVKASVAKRLRQAAQRYQVQIDEEQLKMAEPLLVAGPRMMLGERPAGVLDNGEIVRLPYVKVGEWNFRDSYGPVQVTESDLDGIVSNFQRDARRQDLPLLVNEEHKELPDGADPKSYVGPGAVGWINNLERKGDMIWADVELNRLGEELYARDSYRAVSPELLLHWIDPETDRDWGKTAAGLAFTTMPRMKGLANRGPGFIAASERARVLAFADAPLDKPDQADDSQDDSKDGKDGPDDEEPTKTSDWGGENPMAKSQETRLSLRGARNSLRKAVLHGGTNAGKAVEHVGNALDQMDKAWSGLPVDHQAIELINKAEEAIDQGDGNAAIDLLQQADAELAKSQGELSGPAKMADAPGGAGGVPTNGAFEHIHEHEHKDGTKHVANHWHYAGTNPHGAGSTVPHEHEHDTQSQPGSTGREKYEADRANRESPAPGDGTSSAATQPDVVSSAEREDQFVRQLSEIVVAFERRVDDPQAWQAVKRLHGMAEGDPRGGRLDKVRLAALEKQHLGLHEAATAAMADSPSGQEEDHSHKTLPFQTLVGLRRHLVKAHGVQMADKKKSATQGDASDAEGDADQAEDASGAIGGGADEGAEMTEVAPVTCDKCQGSGKNAEGDACVRCGGKGKLAAAEAIQTGSAGARVKNPPGADEPAASTSTVEPCPSCGGKGHFADGKPCRTCGGAGQINPGQVTPGAAQSFADSQKFAYLSSVHVDGPMNSANGQQLSVAYAYPNMQRLPLHTAEGVQGSMARFMTVEASEEERNAAWTKLAEAAAAFGLSIPASWHQLSAAECVRILMQEAARFDEAVHSDAYLQAVDGIKQLIKQETDEGEPEDLGDLIAIWQSLQTWWAQESDEPAGDSGDDDYSTPRLVVAMPVLPSSPTDPGDLSGGADLDATSADDLAGGAAGGRYAEVGKSRATPNSQHPSPSVTTPKEVTRMSDKNEPAAGDAATAEPVSAAPETTPVEPKVNAAETADMAEMRNDLKAAENRADKAEQDFAEAKQRIAVLEERNATRDAAERMAKISDKLEAAVKTGRITPASRDKFSEQIAKFSENGELWAATAEAIELLPANSAVPMQEVGNGGDAPNLDESSRLDILTRSHQAKQFAETGVRPSYKEALLFVSKRGA